MGNTITYVNGFYAQRTPCTPTCLRPQPTPTWLRCTVCRLSTEALHEALAALAAPRGLLRQASAIFFSSSVPVTCTIFSLARFLALFR